MVIAKKAPYSNGHLTYQNAGVNYGAMDPLKRMAQQAGRTTKLNLKPSGMSEIASSRGEAAYVVDNGNSYLAFVQEGLGTKNLVADAMRAITGKTYYDWLAQDTVAMIVNDLITVGARPTTILAYWAVGDCAWFEDQDRMADLVHGWTQACNSAGASWGGGETPTLVGVIQPGTIDLAGSGFGVINPKERLTLGDKLQAGDAIVLLESSGIHANGLSLARKIAGTLPKGYQTKLAQGEMFGEALLKPTILYAALIQDLFEDNIDIHYMANITGHGWRKIMRHNNSFIYRITDIPPVPPVLQFMIEKGPITETEAYGNLNMGAGFALFVPANHAEKVVAGAKKHKIKAYVAGRVEQKQVIIEPKNIIFDAHSLQVRG